MPHSPLHVLLLVSVAVAGAACCHICETPDAGTKTPPPTASYSCQALAADSTVAACIGGPPPGLGGPVPDPEKRFPLGCKAVGGAATAGTTRTCICEATSMLVDARGSQPVWACPR